MATDIHTYIHTFFFFVAKFFIRNVHPDVENGIIDSEILNRLKEFDINKEKNSNFDARWDKLKELKK